MEYYNWTFKQITPGMSKYRASYSGYVVLCGIWVLLLIANLIIWLREENAGDALLLATFAGLMATLFATWLAGFCIVIGCGKFRYRNGLYQWSECELDDIRSAKTTWISWRVLTRALKVPRLVVTDRNGNSILVNIKPFSRKDSRVVNEILNARQK